LTTAGCKSFARETKSGKLAAPRACLLSEARLPVLSASLWVQAVVKANNNPMIR
jgi:hypothetical protein